MANKRIKWSSLLNYSEIQFEPEPPKILEVSDEIVQSLSWLTAATRHDRRLLRCTQQGALLVANAWSGLNSVEVDELHPSDGSPDSSVPTADHTAVLISSSTQIVKLGFQRKSGGVVEYFYVPPNSYLFYPYKVYQVIIYVVPATGGTASYVGATYLI